MFQQVEQAPPDAILGLNEAFQRDPATDKINLTVGVFKDASGKTPVLNCVKEAERRLVQSEATKSYLGIDGMPKFDELARNLLFGEEHEIVTSGRCATLQTPGGTGALRVAADLVKKVSANVKIWCSDPTWPNHPSVFRAAGMESVTYPYFDPATNSVKIDEMLNAVRSMPSGDVICLHACCHNPTGADPSPEQWKQIADAVYEQGLIPLIDFAYQGFGDGLQEDAAGLHEFCRPGCELIVASSYSKNFGLYRERIGALSIVATDEDAAQRVLSQAKICVRTNYSNPPAHGAGIVATILEDADLRAAWESELTEMRDRINSMRRQFSEMMSAKCPQRDFSYLAEGRGMFSFSGLTAEQVDLLREKHSVYIVRNGRINVAGMTDDNIEQLCDRIASVL